MEETMKHFFVKLVFISQKPCHVNHVIERGGLTVVVVVVVFVVFFFQIS